MPPIDSDLRTVPQNFMDFFKKRYRSYFPFDCLVYALHMVLKASTAKNEYRE